MNETEKRIIQLIDEHREELIAIKPPYDRNNSPELQLF